MGANISLGRTNKGHINYIVHKIHNRLSAWKHQCLSLSLNRWLVLLCIITWNMWRFPNLFMMRSRKSNVFSYEEILSTGERPHLIEWDMCCQQKLHGGLGIKKSIRMRFFSWRCFGTLLKKPDDLWCRMLLSKYGRSSYVSLVCISQPYDSLL